VEKDTARIRWPEQSVVGDAARREVLERAGIGNCSSVVITTRDDDMNIYLALYCRKLRPDVQIIARSTRERNVETLHRAGADFVMSYATTGATTVANLLRQVDILMVSEGLHLFRLDTPPALVGRSLAEAGIRESTGCTVIAVGRGDHVESSPDLKRPLTTGSQLVLLGDDESENRFMARFGRPTV